MNQKKTDKSEIAFFAILFTFAMFVIITLVGFGYSLGALKYRNMQEETYLKIGYEQGRIQVLDSLRIAENETKNKTKRAANPFRTE